MPSSAVAASDAGDDCAPSPTGDSAEGVASGVLKMFQRRWNNNDDQTKKNTDLLPIERRRKDTRSLDSAKDNLVVMES